MASAESSSLTAKWILNVGKSTSQKALLIAMGRPPWQRYVIDKAGEDFNLKHFKKKTDSGRDIHFFQKNVKIYLDSIVLKLLSTIFNEDTDKVIYSHQLTANGKSVEHKDDEKQFGGLSIGDKLDRLVSGTWV